MSPIKGLTDRGLAFPEIGQVRKGAKKGENRPGADLTYFRVEFDEQEKTAAAKFREVYGDKPQKIRIIFPFNEIEKMWDAWYEAYTAGRMVARSDGEYITYQLSHDGEIIVRNGVSVANGQKVKHPENGIAGEDFKGNPVKFKASGRMKIIVPELSRAAYLTVMTTSIHDIANISAQLSAFKELNNGQLAGIPFELRRRPKPISTPSGKDNTRVRRLKSLISIEADPEWVRAKLMEVRALAMPQINEGALLPEPEDVTDAELELDDDDLTDGPIDQPEDNPEEAAPIELIAPLSEWAVTQAAKVWNCDTKQAAQNIAKMKLGKTIDKREFIQIIEGAPK